SLRNVSSDIAIRASAAASPSVTSTVPSSTATRQTPSSVMSNSHEFVIPAVFSGGILSGSVSKNSLTLSIRGNLAQSVVDAAVEARGCAGARQLVDRHPLAVGDVEARTRAVRDLELVDARDPGLPQPRERGVVVADAVDQDRDAALEMAAE